jgi:hypothetical protein
MEWLKILAGLAVLFFGRRLFWLFVGCVGFIVGFELAGDMLQGQPEWVILVIALGVGVIGAIASVFLQRIFIVVAGFFAGGYCLSTLASAALHMQDEAILWISFAVGGLLGAILSLALLDPALIIMSSLAGATAVSQKSRLIRRRGRYFSSCCWFWELASRSENMRAKPNRNGRSGRNEAIQ